VALAGVAIVTIVAIVTKLRRITRPSATIDGSPEIDDNATLKRR
jgi:hypothetical protein